jgi:hypothetical protein
MSFTPARITATLAALSAVVVVAPAADAKKPVKDAGPVLVDCGYSADTPFAPWHDKRGYVLTPDGGFENAADGWTLDNGSAVAEGNETFQVGSPTDHQSLALPAGSAATSPAMCVAKHDGVFRLFTRSTGSKARLRVDVLYANGKRGKRSVLRGNEAWAPTRKLAIALGRAKGKGKLSTAIVSLRFTPLAGDWQIDDVYLDPRLRH